MVLFTCDLWGLSWGNAVCLVVGWGAACFVCGLGGFFGVSGSVFVGFGDLICENDYLMVRLGILMNRFVMKYR